MTGAVKHHDGQLVECFVFGTRNGVQVVANRFGDVDCSAGIRADGDLVHVYERPWVEHRAAFRHSNHAERVAAAKRGEGGAVDWVDGHVGDGFAAVADPFAVEQHGGFVLFSLADHDNAIHVDGFQQVAHRIYRSAVGGVLITTTHPFRSRKGR